MGRWTGISKQLLGPDELRLRKMDLFLDPEVNDKFGFGTKEPLVLFEEDSQYLYVPRVYAHAQMGNKIRADEVKDTRSLGSVCPMRFNAKLWPEQQMAVRNLSHAIKSLPWNGAILQSPCGSGKTTMALAAVADLGRTTLVVVHTEFLRDQWRDRIAEVMGMPTSAVGLIQGNTCDFEGKKIAVGMIQTLADRDYSFAEDYFGCIVYDECHRLGAPFFSQCVTKFNAMYRIGLSATPDRKDGLENVFYWHIGNVVQGVKSWQVKPMVYQVEFPMVLMEDGYQFRNGQVRLAKLITDLTNSTKRNLWLLGELEKAASRGRKILLLSDRLEHLSTLQQMFDGRTHRKYSSGFMVGGMSEVERSLSSEKQVIFATFQYVKEGFDLPELDCMFLTTPHSDVEQAVGRLLRKVEGKKQPVVVDVVDALSVTRAFGRRRADFYRARDFDVRNIQLTV